MSLKETIKENMKAAFKAGDSATRSTLQMLLSVIQNREIEKRAKTGEAELTDDEIVSVISTEIKRRKDSAEQYEAGGRPELAETERAEAATLMQYMPEQMSEDEVQKLIADAVASTGASTIKDLGKVMGAVAPKTKGKFDGARLNELVKQALNG